VQFRGDPGWCAETEMAVATMETRIWSAWTVNESARESLRVPSVVRAWVWSRAVCPRGACGPIDTRRRAWVRVPRLVLVRWFSISVSSTTFFWGRATWPMVAHKGKCMDWLLEGRVTSALISFSHPSTHP
jgi:hypothetical protein